MKNLFLLSVILLFAFSANAQIVNIPDFHFKNALVSDPSINTNLDTEIQESEAIALTGTLDVICDSIADMTGIEAFINIKELQCSSNLLTALDLTYNPVLTRLDCSQNFIDTLNVYNNISLEYLSCCDNQLTTLNVSNNIFLNNLDCSQNQISTIDLSYNSFLEELICSTNHLNILDVSNNTYLIRLRCDCNPFDSLDLSNNSALTNLKCNDNQLTTIDLSNNTALTYLECMNNELITLDLSNNPALKHIDCQHNQLNSFNIKNGNNTIITYFFTYFNPDLYCIQVDDSLWSEYFWLTIDPQSYFSNDCHYASVPNELQTSELKVSPNPFTVSTTIRFNNPDNNSYVLSLTDASGRTVIKVNDVTGSEFILDKKDLKPGVYFMELKGRIRTYRDRIMVE